MQKRIVNRRQSSERRRSSPLALGSDAPLGCPTSLFPAGAESPLRASEAKGLPNCQRAAGIMQPIADDFSRSDRLMPMPMHSEVRGWRGGGIGFGMWCKLVANSRHRQSAWESRRFMNTRTGHSSTIRGWLEANGQRFPLAQVGPDYCVVRHSVATPPTDAELVIEIDGDQRRDRVFPQDGISESTAVVKFARR
jgi:hypothetical protein